MRRVLKAVANNTSIGDLTALEDESSVEEIIKAYQELWRELDAAASQHDVDWRWVKGHAGDAGNERADALARAGADAVRSQR